MYRNIGKNDFSHDEVFFGGYVEGSYGVQIMAAETKSYAVW